MKKFIKTIFTFILILTGYFMFNFLFNQYQISKTKIPFGDTSVLIMGDSYPQRGLNPALFTNAQNISQGSEPLYISFWKLKYLTSKIKIDTLLLSFSHHSISAFNDNKLLDKKWSSEMFRRTYAIVNYFQESAIHFDKNDFYNVYFRNVFLYPQINHLNIIGGYEPTDNNELTHIDISIQRHFYKNDSVLKMSNISIIYLDSILDLCKRKNIVPVLLSSPVTDEYFSLIPSTIKKEYNNQKYKYEQMGVQVLDLSQADFSDDLFMNGDHLNQKGATKFTLEIYKMLKYSPL